MKKTILLLISTLVSLQLSFAQIGIKTETTYGTNGTFSLLDEDFDFLLVSNYNLSDGSGSVGIGTYYDYNNDEEGFIVIKLDNQGKAVTSFGTNGVVKLNGDEFSNFFTPLRVRETANQGLIILFSDDIRINSTETALVSLSSNGSIVNTFGTEGILNNPDAITLDFDVRNDGKILALSSVQVDDTTSIIGFIRYNANGTLDTSYGVDGVTLFDEEGPLFSSMERAGANDYFCIGANIDFNTLDMAAAISKINIDGTLNTSFGTNGTASTNIFSEVFVIPVAEELVKLTDGAFLLKGTALDLFSDSIYTFIGKINSDGTASKTFGKDGYMTFPYTDFDYESFTVLATPNNKFLITEAISDDDDNSFTSLRLYDSNGTVQTQFGQNGEVLYKIDGNTTSGAFKSSMRNDGKILLAGGFLDGASLSIAATATLISLQYGVSTKDANISNVSVYPNPVSTTTTLSFDNNDAATIAINLLDVTGKLVQNVQPATAIPAGKQQITFQLQDNIPAGVYFLKVENTTQGISTFKLTKF